MSTVGYAEFAIGRIDKPANSAHCFGNDGNVLFTIDEKRGHANAPIAFTWGLDATASEKGLEHIGPIVIQRRPQSFWSPQGLLIHSYVCIRKGARPDACLAIHFLDPREIICTGPPLR